jgi:type III secretory pathway lipoprotein EscJ
MYKANYTIFKRKENKEQILIFLLMIFMVLENKLLLDNLNKKDANYMMLHLLKWHGTQETMKT